MGLFAAPYILPSCWRGPLAMIDIIDSVLVYGFGLVCGLMIGERLWKSN